MEWTGILSPVGKARQGQGFYALSPAHGAAIDPQHANDPGQGLGTIGSIPFWENIFPGFGPTGVNGGLALPRPYPGEFVPAACR
jgi:hypothetical protein